MILAILIFKPMELKLTRTSQEQLPNRAIQIPLVYPTSSDFFQLEIAFNISYSRSENNLSLPHNDWIS